MPDPVGGGPKRDLVSIDDLPDETLLGLMREAREIRAADRLVHNRDLTGVLLASLFLEPSTRTRLSFEAAMQRLGGGVITCSDPSTSSASKGESLRDTARMVDAYADVIVLRHPSPGAARLAARNTTKPVINAGDGSREHPSQTLVDLVTLESEIGAISNLTVMLYGDLRFGRTTHSLIRALMRFGARVVAVGQSGLELPDSLVAELGARPDTGVSRVRLAGLEGRFGGQPEAVVCGPASEIVEQEAGTPWTVPAIDALYVTRLQRERLTGEACASGPGLPVVDGALLDLPVFARTLVLHPLPRVGEIAPSLDGDPRAGYFRQAAWGVPLRMALLRWAMGLSGLPGPREAVTRAASPGEVCRSLACVRGAEPGATLEEVRVAADGAPRCAWCDEPMAPSGSARPDGPRSSAVR